MESYSQNALDTSPLCQPPCPVSTLEASFKLDEGYSEDTRSQDGSDIAMPMESRPADLVGLAVPAFTGIPDVILNWSESDRLGKIELFLLWSLLWRKTNDTDQEYVMNIIRTLRTPAIAALAQQLIPYLHIDPVMVLPPEITSDIFSYLSPSMLLAASTVSRSWRERTLDGRLWRQKFHAEGWTLNAKEVKEFEEGCRAPIPPRKSRSRRAEAHTEQPSQKRRARVSRTGSIARDESQRWNDQVAPVEADGDEDTIMVGSIVHETKPDRDSQSNADSTVERAQSLNRMDTSYTIHSEDEGYTNILSVEPQSYETNNMESPTDQGNLPMKESQLMAGGSSRWPRLDFHEVYKQKRKLEENWAAGRYKSFQLPHRDYPEEAHGECVYTIQYSGKYLVSGSRDRTLRIWDLETQRLIKKPLCGHTGSVLCLQFDANTEEDIIASGSSDTHVILWRFSTGEIIKKLERAHKESVLNLKFDRRFLVTCSKDKTIKIWNRQDLQPGHEDYPVRNARGGGKCPSYIVDLTGYSTLLQIQQNLSAEQMEPLPPYSLIMTLDHHGAAVNAIHILNDQLVSASGDRTIKVFDIHTGVNTAFCSGHTKGIACVQYDGKRIVSGSSDNTIRIFDPISRAEVACLTGHGHLVRTIQAAFGDPPGARDELEKEAQEVDQRYFDARRSGVLPASSITMRRTRERNAGSKRPEDIMATGAKIPPGGGGSRWGRIVSGSYDETIIIWKKDDDGRWVPGHRLRQAEALRAAGGPILAQSEINRQQQSRSHSHPQTSHPSQTRGPLPAAAAHSSQTAQPGNVQPTQSNPPTVQQLQAHASAQQIVHQAMQTGAAALQTGVQNIAAINSQFSGNGLNPAFNNALHHHSHGPQPFQLSLQQINQHLGQYFQNSQAGHPHALATLSSNIQQQQQQYAQQQVLIHGRPLPQDTTQFSQPNARVFKLQFDARRIICCSQDPKIVGWDFAAGDEQIVECSRFFGVPA